MSNLDIFFYFSNKKNLKILIINKIILSLYKNKKKNMDTDNLEEFLDDFTSDIVEGDDTTFTLTQEDINDVSSIKNMRDDELVSEWKILVWKNHIYRQISISEMMRIQLIGSEIEVRNNINSDELVAWYEDAKEKFDYKDYM